MKDELVWYRPGNFPQRPWRLVRVIAYSNEPGISYIGFYADAEGDRPGSVRIRLSEIRRVTPLEQLALQAEG